MNDSVYKISLDIHEHASQAVLKAKKTDTGRKLHITLRAGGAPYTIANDCRAVFKATKPDRTVLFNNCTIENNEIIYEFTEQTCTSVGRCKCEIALYGPNNKIITSPRFFLLVDSMIYPDEIVESTDEFSELAWLITDTLEATHAATLAAQKADQAANDANEVINKFGDHPIKFIDNTNVEVKTVLHELPEGAYMLTGFFPYNEKSDVEGIHFSNDLVIVEKYENEDSVVVQFLKGRYLYSASINSDNVDYTSFPLQNFENTDNRTTIVDDRSDNKHYPTSKAVYDAITKYSGSSSSGTTDHSMYFDIDADGVVSLKEEYRGLGYRTQDTELPFSKSDNGYDNEGSLISELPESLVIPDVINNIAVAALAPGMFAQNKRIKSVTIPKYVTVIPQQFALKAPNLSEVNGTENIETVCKGGFIHSGIRKALFPNLKTFDNVGQFNGCANLAIVDIGDTVTDIPSGCFADCERLSLIRGGASVATIGPNAFLHTRSLKNLPMIKDAGKETSPITSIGATAFLNTRVYPYDWWALKDNPGKISFGTKATPAHYNANKWWGSRTYTACENPLNSTFHQDNPEWADVYLPRIEGNSYVNSHGKWGDGCLEIAAVHIISALTGIKFNSPVEFIELLKGKTDEQGNLLAPVGRREDSSGNEVPAYVRDDMLRWFKAMDLECEQVAYNSTDIQKIDAALADGGMVLSFYYVGSSTVNHAVAIYGIAENGEALLLDSDGPGINIGDYTPRTFQMPFYSFATKDSWAIIVKKPKEE